LGDVGVSICRVEAFRGIDLLLFEVPMELVDFVTTGYKTLGTFCYENQLK